MFSDYHMELEINFDWLNTLGYAIVIAILSLVAFAMGMIGYTQYHNGALSIYGWACLYATSACVMVVSNVSESYAVKRYKKEQQKKD